MIQSRLLRRVGLLLALGAAYFIAGKLGLRLAFVNASATAVWPPTGIALVAFVLLGYDVWPAILASAFLVNLTTTGSVATSIGIALGNTLEGVVGAYLVNRFARGRRAFDRPQDVFVFTALAAMVSTSVSATVGVTTISLAGYARWAEYGSIWWTWWLGDAAGDLVVAPALMLWFVTPRRPGGRAQPGGGPLAPARGERSADRPCQLSPAHLRDRRGDQAVPADRAVVRRRAPRHGRPEEDQRQFRPPGGQPGAVPRGGNAVRVVPRDGYRRALRRR